MALLQLLESSPLLLTVMAAAVGLAVGSFLNVVIYRLPKMLENELLQTCHEHTGGEIAAPPDTAFNLVTPASRCPHCGHRITALENIPVISYLVLKGRCAGCNARISPRYPVIELATALVSVITVMTLGYGVQALAALFFAWAMIALFMIDFDTMYLPDNITLPLLWAGLLLSLGNVFVDTHTSIVGATAGYLSLWTVYHVFKMATGKEGMGYGDFKLLAAIGAWVGWMSLPIVILFSSLVGAVIGIALILFRGREHGQPMPFGPFLAAAGWITLLWGEPILGFWLG